MYLNIDLGDVGFGRFFFERAAARQNQNPITVGSPVKYQNAVALAPDITIDVYMSQLTAKIIRGTRISRYLRTPCSTSCQISKTEKKFMAGVSDIKSVAAMQATVTEALSV